MLIVAYNNKAILDADLILSIPLPRMTNVKESKCLPLPVRVTLNNATYSIQDIVYRAQNTKSQIKIQSTKPTYRIKSDIPNANTAYKQDIM